MTIIRMLGIDPSLTHTGYAVAEVDVATCAIVRVTALDTLVTEPSKIKTIRKSSDDLARARYVADGLKSVITNHNIKVSASEVPSGAQDAKASRAFGIVVGILAMLPIPMIEVTPTEVKLASHGTKTADKEDIVRWAVNKTINDGLDWNTTKRANDWGIMIGDEYVTKNMEHQADAIASIEAAIRSQQFKQLAGMMAALIS